MDTSNKIYKLIALIGLSLSCGHLLTLYNWFDRQIYRLFTDPWTSCFPFFYNCKSISFLTQNFVHNYLQIYFVFSGLTLLLFLKTILSKTPSKKWENSAYLCLLITTFLKLALQISRYELMGNYHIIHFTLSFIFLIIPKNINFYLLALTLQYFLAGLLKINLEWHSGAALLKASPISGEMALTSLGYASFLETFLIWGLLSSKLWIRIITLFQLILFHIYSWYFVGYFYPVMMLLLLVPIGAFLVNTDSQPYIKKLRRDFQLWPRKSIVAIAFLIFIVLVNIANKIPSDPSLDGESRFFRLSMLDARTDCRIHFILFEENKTTVLNLPERKRGLRIHCDPVVYKTYLNEACQNITNAQTIGYFHWSKRSTDKIYTLIESNKNYCGQIL